MAVNGTTNSPYEPIFAKYAGAIPQAYLRTLAYKESSFKADVVHPQSNATGLFQITSICLQGFNKAKGTALKLAQLKDPNLNTIVAVYHLGHVIGVYAQVRSLKPDWTSRRWLELLTLGWNAGHNAIIGLAKQMEASGLPPERITVDSASQLARATGKGKYVAEPDRVAWSKSVATMFLGGGIIPTGKSRLRQLASMLPALPAAKGGGIAVAFALAAAGAALILKKKEASDDFTGRAAYART
ncbi:MAG: transglycosylase SLT domain-containing protein [Deltaproteobacteria bacterium]|nr:transglycosylase SLT domain-containing protein [Deltaproteobacteria bacterium]